ncbi:AzlD domain-containing protein [Microaerobacter geothermalis]|uniref:AzlD domain-containing protein n=1 Tax=Microaerobacter geothermalis TaxID=674972 RepID=UPI001F257E74|nr:AzlD domain-containing protein [Microaerobacter geothermalis]MCF6094392.1 AzlD domain-containing protein [Microaerobacter geothermalis]
MEILFLIFGMFAVTYIPRMLPMVIGSGIHFPHWLNQWLQYVPYAALGALIFPGILTVNPDKPWIGLLGGALSFLLAYIQKNIILVVLGSILGVMGLQQML